MAREYQPTLSLAAFTRHFACAWRADRETESVRLLCDPDVGPWMAHFGGFRVVGSFYWENLDGLRDTCAFFTAEDDETARRIVEARGVTHVLIPVGPNIVRQLFYLRHGHDDPASLGKTLGARLFNAPPDRWPAWLVPDETLDRIGGRSYRFGADGPYTTRYRVARVVPASPAQFFLPSVFPKR